MRITAAAYRNVGPIGIANRSPGNRHCASARPACGFAAQTGRTVLLAQ